MPSTPVASSTASDKHNESASGNPSTLVKNVNPTTLVKSVMRINGLFVKAATASLKSGTSSTDVAAPDPCAHVKSYR